MEKFYVRYLDETVKEGEMSKEEIASLFLRKEVLCVQVGALYMRVFGSWMIWGGSMEAYLLPPLEEEYTAEDAEDYY
jgi:hypothetical protein